MKILDTPSLNFNGRPLAVDAIILHYTDMISAEAALAWLTNPTSNVSAHYLIYEDGTIYRMVEEEHRAWHAGMSFWQGQSNLNDSSIGIELANPGHTHGYRLFPDVQVEALIELCLDLQKRWKIPQNRILGHSDIAPERKQDPGHLFPWEKLASFGLGMWPKDLENLNAPSPDLSRCERPTPPTKGEVIHAQNPSPLVREGGLLAKVGNSRVRGAPETSLQMLSQIGYDTTSPHHALLAFQRHFQPHKVDGVADAETCAFLEGLLTPSKRLI